MLPSVFANLSRKEKAFIIASIKVYLKREKEEIIKNRIRGRRRR
jgi:uncharacterized protein (DUF2164 family)